MMIPVRKIFRQKNRPELYAVAITVITALLIKDMKSSPL